MVGLFDYEELVKATENFSPSRIIGKGSHGSVYKAIREVDRLEVAVKTSSFSSSVHVLNDNLKKLESEINILSSLNKNPFVVNFLGSTTSSTKENDKFLVMEYMPNGSLYDLLHISNSIPLTWQQRVEIALQIARGVKFLHELNPNSVIHRDIKSANILFDDNWVAKVADFGLAVSMNQATTYKPAGTLGYLDPCYTDPSKLSTKIDVFSYGVVLLEILSCRKAMDMNESPPSIVEWAVPLIENQNIMIIMDKRTDFPRSFMDGVARNLLNIAARCVSKDENIRPSMAEVVMEIEICLIKKRSSKNVVPVWMNFSWSSVIPKRKRIKLASKCSSEEGHDHDVRSKIRSGRVSLKEILADR
ncbi:hypothetical protein ACFE04_023852 [Oxalis oulophora]